MSRPVAVITGAGGGLGLHHAIALAGSGYAVVVNDLGVGLDGSQGGGSPASDAVQKVRALGGVAVGDGHDVSTWEGGEAVVETALREFGRIDVLVCNAGILRDRMIVNLTDEDWDDVVAVHLRGTFGPVRAAARWWREQSKAGQPRDARVITTTSTSGLFGNPGQGNYGAAKAGIAALTVIAAQELARYGVSVNAIAPGARTRMTDGLIEPSADGVDPYDPASVSALVAWLAGPSAAGITGEVFFVQGGTVSVLQGWASGPTHRQSGSLSVADLEQVVPSLLAAIPVRPADGLLEGERR